MTDVPACINCDHSNRVHDTSQRMICLRRSYFNPVEGLQSLPVNCLSERANVPKWLTWLFGERCGPNAKYFVLRKERSRPPDPLPLPRADKD